MLRLVPRRSSHVSVSFTRSRTGFIASAILSRIMTSSVMLILSRQDVERLLDPDELIDAIGAAMADLSAGRASMPPRNFAHVRDAGGILAAMPAYVPASGALAAKLVLVFHGNAARGIETP